MGKNILTVQPPLRLKKDFREAIVRLCGRESATRSELRRAGIVLRMDDVPVNFSELEKETGHCRDTIRCWYWRVSYANGLWEEMAGQILRETGHAGPMLRKERLVSRILADRPRSGAPCKYSSMQYTDIAVMALKPPSEFGRPITHWTARELADEVHLLGVAPGISSRQVGRFLEEADIKPHRSQYWLNPKIDDHDEFKRQVSDICTLYMDTPGLHAEGTHVVSTDEKTGIQALERNAPAKPMLPGHPEKIEFEYTRHGTLSLIPSFDVATGKITQYRIGPTRDEDDFAGHIAATIATDSKAKWIFVLDQLNTHMSESLVRMAAELSGYDGDLGEKGRHGILKDIKSRREFLENPGHRVRFVYTPKHCSWLNQVEIWFGVLSRKILKRGNFTSMKNLERKIRGFIDYFNRTMAKAYKWTYKGLPLTG